MSRPGDVSLSRKVARQGAWLFAGHAGAQLCAFARNALLGHMLSKGDFGTAATLTIILQTFETISDVAVDRMIVQAEDGDDARLTEVAHAFLIARGVAIGLALWLGAPMIAGFFALPDAAWAFQGLAIVALIKGFSHLDFRRYQRRLENRPLLAVEAFPQLAALVLTVPAIEMTGDFSAVVWLAGVQAVFAVMLSHLVAERTYRIGIDTHLARRFFQFGWPVLLSALPLLVVYQGDRIIVARAYGIEALAGYSAAFMLTMVPALLVAKVGLSLMLPLLSGVQTDTAVFRQRFNLLCAGTAVFASLYVAAFAFAGPYILPIAFGAQYRGLGDVLTWLAIMWGLRMLHMAPGAALMALASTRPHLIAGTIRATALGLAFAAAQFKQDLALIAACGVVGEILSLAYLTDRIGRRDGGLRRDLARSLAFLVTAIGATLAIQVSSPLLGTAISAIAHMGVFWLLIVGAAAAAFAAGRRQCFGAIRAAG